MPLEFHWLFTRQVFIYKEVAGNFRYQTSLNSITMESLQTPTDLELFIDTSLEYKIDMSLFPGIDNGQPMLLIHSPSNCLCSQAEPSPCTSSTDHDSLEGMTSDDEEPISSPLKLMSSPCVTPLWCSSPSDSSVADTALTSPDFPSDVLAPQIPATLSPYSSSFLEAGLGDPLDHQLYPNLSNKTDEWLEEPFLIKNDVLLCDFGSRKKRKRSADPEESDVFKKRRKIDSLITDILGIDSELLVGV